MSCIVTTEDILSVPADAAVLGVEITLRSSDGRVCRRLEEAGGEELRLALKKQRFLPVGSAFAAGSCGLPFQHLIATAVPRWLTGMANELLVLRSCYESAFDLAEKLGCRRVVLPFLSAMGYRFPREKAVHIACRAAQRRKNLVVVFAADTAELAELSRREYRKPAITGYVGYYRDWAVFSLDNGSYVRVDLRPELRRVEAVPYVEPCYLEGNNPLQPPLAQTEIARLRTIYEESEL